MATMHNKGRSRPNRRRRQQTMMEREAAADQAVLDQQEASRQEIVRAGIDGNTLLSQQDQSRRGAFEDRSQFRSLLASYVAGGNEQNAQMRRKNKRRLLGSNPSLVV